MSLRRFGRIRDELVNSITRTTGVAIDLLQQQPWDLFLMAISATHRGGHRLWDLSSINQTIPAAQRADLENALQTVYQSADAAVGRLISAAGPDTRVVVYAVHGMGANTSYSEILPQMLARILGQETETSLDLSRRVRDAIPLAWRQSIKHALPFVLQDKLTAHWRMAQSDWQQTQGLTVVADNQGYIRINLRGREAAGIVEPGAEYDQLCDKIIAGLSSFVDSESGQPVVKAVARSADVIEPGARSHLLPDIIVRWSQETRHWRRAITSPAFGIIEWPTPGQLPDGRSGNHHNRGFWLSGSPLASPSQTATRPYHTIDIAPTVYDLLNLSPPPHLRGHSLYPRKKSDGD
jgi:predicted AlkP superfamily phosphohydrolase/phosphomutase